MASIIFWGGAVVYFIGVVWLVYHAWTNEKPVWAVGIFCLGWIVGLIYAGMNFDETKVPGGILLLGAILQISGKLMGG